MHFFCQSSNATEDQQNDQNHKTEEEDKVDYGTDFDQEQESIENCSLKSNDEVTDFSGQYCEQDEKASSEAVENDELNTNLEDDSPPEQGKLQENISFGSLSE